MKVNKKGAEIKQPTPTVEVQPKVDVDEPAAPGPVYKQFELSETDITLLNLGQYSDKAWEAVGRRHKIDPTTREKVDGSAKVYIAVPKNWPKLPPVTGVPVTTQNIDGMSQALGITGNAAPIQARDNIEGVRAALRKANLTKPISDETHEEEV